MEGNTLNNSQRIYHFDINIEYYIKKVKHFKTPKYSQVAQKIFTLREDLGGFKETQDLTQLPEITNLEWEEWKEQGIIITVD